MPMTVGIEAKEGTDKGTDLDTSTTFTSKPWDHQVMQVHESVSD